MVKPYHVHYSNKYPGGKVHSSESAMDVFCSSGKHRVALRKNGADQWADVSKELGCVDQHDLSPIPKDARFMKLWPEGHIGQAEEHDDRLPKAQGYASSHGGKVPSIKELEDAAKKAAKAQAAQ